MKRLLFTLLILTLGSFLYADNHVAASLSQTDIQAAVDASSNGDTVQLPSGTLTTFTGTVTVNKEIEVYGAGKASTIIRRNAAHTDPMFLIAADNVILRDFELDGTGDGTTQGECIEVEGGTDFNIHDMVLRDNDMGGVHIDEYPCDGVIWNVDFIDIDRAGWGYGVFCNAKADGETNANGLQGTQSWADDLDLGAGTGIYVEDCTFTNVRNAFSLQCGGRIVFRYNTCYMDFTGDSANLIDSHGPSVYGRGGRQFEVYENICIKEDGGHPWFGIFASGSGVIYNNTITGLAGLTYFFYFRHPCCTDDDCEDAFTVRMTDSGETCTMTITGDPATALTTDASGAVTDFNLDLTHADYDTFAEVVAAIDADPNYTCTIGDDRDQHSSSSRFATVAAQDIESAPYVAQYDLPIRDKATAVYFWGNTVNDISENTPAQASACNDEPSQPYYVEDVDWFDEEMPAYTPYTYPYPGRESSGVPGQVKGPVAIKGIVTIKEPESNGENGDNGHGDQPKKPKPRMAPQNPKYKEWKEQRQRRLDLGLPLEKDNGYMPPKQDMSHLFYERIVHDEYFSIGNRAYGTMSGFAYPDDFDLRSCDDGQAGVTSAKNQGACGSCWAFASVSILESAILDVNSGSVDSPHMSFDLAEEFVKQCTQHDPGCNNATISFAMGVLSTEGIVLEECDPYVAEASPPCNPNDCPERYIVTGYQVVLNTEATIKQAIYDNGAVYATMDGTFYIDADTNTLTFASDYDGTCVAYSDDTSISHAVNIVGWSNDSLDICDDGGIPGSSTNYWICKNSWGTDWGDDGFFYIDIAHDAGLGYTWQVTDYKVWNPSDVMYHYDDCGWQNQFGYSDEGGDETVAYGLVKFTATGNQTLYAVGFFSPTGQDVDYTIYVYDGFDGTDLGNLLTSQSSQVTDAGLYTVDLDTPQEFELGDTIVIVLKMDTDNYEYPICVDDEDTDYCDIESAKTYMSQTGASGTWTDMGSYATPCDVAIRGITLTKGASIKGTQNVKGTVIIKETR